MPVFAKFVRDPIVHFALLGSIVYALWLGVGPRDEKVIVIDAARIESLAQEARAGSGKEGSSQDELIRRAADTEMLVREARTLGLDVNDTIVRRRLVQKMRFVLEDAAETSEASEAELKAFLAANAPKYMREPTLSFEQVFLAKGEGRQERAQLLLEQLAVEGEARGLGDAFVHGLKFEGRSESELRRMFGEGFLNELAGIELKQWRRLDSPYGTHLVKVHAREAARPALLSEVSNRVREDLRLVQRAQVYEASLSELRERYEIRRGS